MTVATTCMKDIHLKMKMEPDINLTPFFLFKINPAMYGLSATPRRVIWSAFELVAEQTAVLGGMIRGKRHPLFLVTRLAINLGTLFIRLEKSPFEDRGIRTGSVAVCGVVRYLVHRVIGNQCRLLFSGNNYEDPQHHHYHGYKQPITFIDFHARFLRVSVGFYE